MWRLLASTDSSYESLLWDAASICLHHSSNYFQTLQNNVGKRLEDTGDSDGGSEFSRWRQRNDIPEVLEFESYVGRE